MKTSFSQLEADEVYEALLNAHHGLSEQQSQLLNARLILLLAQHVGEAKAVQDLIAAARESPELP